VSSSHEQTCAAVSAFLAVHEQSLPAQQLTAILISQCFDEQCAAPGLPELMLDRPLDCDSLSV
jgi:hypothetical protein